VIAEAAAATVLRVSVAPQRVRLAPGATAVLTVRAPGHAGAAVAVSSAGYDLDAAGRPRVHDGAHTWLRAQPPRLLLGAHATATVRVTAPRTPARAAPGDHPFVVLFAVSERARRGSRVLVRIGVVAVVRVPGIVRHRLVLAGARVLGGPRRRIRVVVLNRGNVEEWLGRGLVSATLTAGPRTVAVLRSAPRRVLAHGRAVFLLAVPRRAQSKLVARVALGPRVAYRLRL
jgi:hypothetical protein